MFDVKPPLGANERNWFLSLPGWKPVGLAVVRIWWVFFALGLSAGLTWRLSGVAPKLFASLDAVGILLCLAAPFLAQPWIKLGNRQSLHQSIGGSLFALRIFSSFKMLGAAVLLALAFTGILLAYDPAQPVARVLTLDMLDYQFQLGIFIPAVLILLAPAYLVLSTVVWLVAMRLAGSTAGPLVWVAFLSVVNMPLSIGSAKPVQLSLGSIAILCRDTLNQVNADPTKGIYFSDLAVALFVVPVSALCLAAMLLAITPVKALGSEVRLDVPWISSVGALIVVGYRYISKTASPWAGAESLAQSDWLGMLALGLLTMMALNLILSAAGFARHTSSYRLRAVALFLLTIPAWPQFTNAAIWSGRASHLDVLTALGVCFLAGAAWVVLVDLMLMFTESSRLAGTVAFAVLAFVLVVPLSSQGSATPFPLVQGTFSALRSSEQAANAYILAGCMLVVTVIGLLMGIKRKGIQKPRD